MLGQEAESIQSTSSQDHPRITMLTIIKDGLGKTSKHFEHRSFETDGVLETDTADHVTIQTRAKAHSNWNFFKKVACFKFRKMQQILKCS